MGASLSSQMISLEAQHTDHQTSSVMVDVLSTGQLQDHALLYALDGQCTEHWSVAGPCAALCT